MDHLHRGRRGHQRRTGSIFWRYNFVNNKFSIIYFGFINMDEQGTGSIFNVNNFPIFKIQYWTQLHQGGVPAFVGFNAGNGTKSYSYMPYSQVRRSRTVGNKFRWFWCSPVLFSDHLCSGPALHRDGQRVPRTPHIQDRREDLTWSLHQVGVKTRNIAKWFRDLIGANLPLVFAPENGNMLGGTTMEW